MRSVRCGPSYHPSALLKLYIYGYLNRVQSSRRLEREAGRNTEVMWLLGRLILDHKPIADFCALPACSRKQVLRSTAVSSRRSIRATRTSRARRWSAACADR